MSWDIFWAGNDRDLTAGRYNEVTASDASWVLRPEGILVNTSSGSNGFALGAVVLIRQSGKPDAYAVVAKKISTTSIFLLPLRSALDGAGAVGTTYGNTATITSGIKSGTPAYETAVTLVVDLTDAPESSYKYLILADASASHSGGSKVLQVVLRSEALVDDPFSGNAVGEAVLDVTNAVTEFWQYNAVKEVTLAGGQRHEFHLQVVNGSTANRARLQNAHILALRVDGWSNYVRSSSNADAAASTAANTTDVVHASATAPSTSTYVAFVAGLVGHSSATAADRVAEVKVKVATTVVASARILLPATTDRVPVGFFAAISPSSGNAVALTVNNQGASGNASVEKGIVAIAPLTSLPSWLAAQLNDSQTSATLTAPAEFTDGATSAGQTIVAGTHIEVIQTGAGIATGTVATDYYALRPVWAGDYVEGQTANTPPLEYENDQTPRGSFGHPGVSATGQVNAMNFFLWRGERIAASGSSNVLQAKYLGASHNVLVGATKFLWLREAEPPVVEPDSTILVAVETERGLVYKSWDPTGTTGLYQISLPGVLRVGRTLLNGVEMTQAAVQSSPPYLTTANTWGWDRTARKAYVYMPSSPAGRTPADDRETIVLCVEEFVSSRACTFIDSDSEYRPYVPELEEPPSVSTELQIRDSGTEVAVSIGDLSLVNAHAKWDDLALQHNFAGLYATIRRGVPSSSGVSTTLLRDLQVLSRAIIDMPEITKDGETFRLGLFDRFLQLRRPLSEARITVYEGTGASASAPRDYVPLPILYSMKLRRVPAYRVTSDAATPTEHWFKVALHSVVAFGSVYASPDDTTPITTGYSPSATDLLCGQFKIKNAGGGGNAAFTQDLVYVDILGGAGAGIDNVGSILEHLLTNYPLRVDEYAGSPATTIATSTHTSASAGATCNVTSSTGFAVGDRVLVVSNASAATYYHATVAAVGVGTLTLVPEYQTGDAAVGTGFTNGASSVVRKVVFSAGLALTDLARSTLRLYDRKWRRSYTGGAYIPDAPNLNLFLDPSATVTDGIEKLMRSFGYAFVNPVGRIELGVVDDDAADLNENPGFEFDLITSPASSRSAYPWNEDGGATSAISTSIKAGGQQCIEVSRTAMQQGGGLGQTIVVPRDGEWVSATALVALRTGDGSAVRLALSDPSSPLREQISDPFEVQSTQWTRISAPFPIPRGAAGTARVKVLPHYPEGIAPFPAVLASTFITTPVPATGVKGWLAARSVVATNGGKVASWTALAGAAATSSGAQRPRWWRNACFHQPAMVFDNVDDTMAWITVSSTPYTIFVVYAATTTDAAFHRALSGGAANWLMGPHKGTGSTLLFHAYTGGTGGATSGYVGAGATVEQANSFACSTLVATSSSLSEHFVNGVSVGTNTATSQAAPGVLNLGKGGASAETLFGRIAEIIVFDSALSTADRQAVEDYLMRTYGIRSVTIAVDDFRCLPVCAVLDEHNSVSFPVKFEPDTFYEAQVSYDVSTQDATIASYIRVTDSEARGLTTAISQAKNALPNAQRLVVDDLLVTDAASAAGLAAAYADYFSRPRHRLRFLWLAPQRVPKIGERAFHWNHRVPELADRNPLHLLTRVTVGSGNAVELETERKTDFVSDRLTIAASDFPIGLIFATVSSTCPGSGYSEELIGMRGYYLVGGATADLSTVVGSPTHRHTLSHTHAVPSHSHTYEFPAQTLGAPGMLDDAVIVNAISVGPFELVSRGVGDPSGPHTHVIGGALTGKTTNTTSLTSNAPSADLFTFYGGNDVSWRRVLFCRRTGGSGNFPTDMILGYNGAASAPSGWNLCDGGGGRPDLRGYAPRAATDVDGTDTTIKTGTTHVSTNDPTGANLDLTSPLRVRRFQRLTITGGGNTFHAVVVRAPGTDGLAADRCKVQSLHEDGDAADGTSYPAGSTIAIDDERPNIAVTIAVHRHAVSGSVGTGAVPSHAHLAPHEHTSTTFTTLAGATGTVNVDMDPTPTFGNGPLARDGHTHAAAPTLASEVGASGAAGGDITSTSTNKPDRYQMPFILPADASQNVVPVKGVAWSLDVCPDGWDHLMAADGLLIVGAAAGVAAGAVVDGHVHTYDAALHTFGHTHGGGGTATTDPDQSGADPTMLGADQEGTPNGRFATYSWNPLYGAWQPGGGWGHVHSVSFNNVSSAGSMTASSSQTSASSSGSGSIPPALTLVTCVRS